MINAGEGGTHTGDALDGLDHWLQVHAHVRNWLLCYGTNDSASGDVRFSAGFETNLRALVQRLQAAGKRVFIPTVPWKTGGSAYLPSYNAAVERVWALPGVRRGPDLYAHFLAHPEHLADGVHPNGQGQAALNRLWAEQVLAAGFYA
jgi:lysophospholipase L1-like esterase